MYSPGKKERLRIAPAATTVATVACPAVPVATLVSTPYYGYVDPLLLTPHTS